MLKDTDFTLKDLTKKDYKAQYEPLISKLLLLQQEARTLDVGLVVLFEGFAAAGKGSRISDLIYNLDARMTRVINTPEIDREAYRNFVLMHKDVKGMHPFLESFWCDLNERGCATFFNRGWYTRALESVTFAASASKHLADYTAEELYDAGVEAFTPLKDSIMAFEKQLADDGYLVVKFFVDIRQETQAQRITETYANPAQRWRISPSKLEELARFHEDNIFFTNAIKSTDTDYAPWIVLNGENVRASNLTIAQTLVSKLEESIAAKRAEKEAAEAAKAAAASAGTGENVEAEAVVNVSTEAPKAPATSSFPTQKKYPTLDKVDYSLALDRKTYKAELKELQARLGELQVRAYLRRIPLVIMYEGWDAAGKGGNIKRIAQALDARAYTIFPSPAPTKTELEHPFLWRYWTRLPKAGHVGIYDRSWYGRVLVERIEGFAKPHEWQRAYDEINQFEHDLVKWGAVVVKFWVEIDQDEQLNRFNLRAQNPEKSWKLTDEDWRNRDKYPQYREAVEDMFRLTSTVEAPWTILESNDKLYARIKALKTVIKALEKRLGE